MVEIIVTIALEVAKCLAPCAERQINYLRKYKTNFENLKTEMEKLRDKSKSIQREVDAAKKKGEEIEESVQKWLEKVKELEKNFHKCRLERGSRIIHDDEAVGKIRKGEETEAAAAAGEIGGDVKTAEVAGEIREDAETVTAKKQCFKGLCPDLKMRYQLSKEAVIQLEDVVKHLKDGKFDKISYPVVPKDLRLLNTGFRAFQSRTSTLQNVINSLSDRNVDMVGIYGMGGIGKTTLAKEVAKQAKENKLFDSVIFVEVTQIPDKMKILQEIAEKLGLTFSQEENESTRAGKLYERLKNEKKILIILDNIWAQLDLLQAIGIPLGSAHNVCKVLLTARSVDVLIKMDSQRNFQVKLLDEEEAWQLFKNMYGDNIKGSEFESVAREIAKKCARLPIVIVTVARALKSKQLFAWKDALRKLNIEDVHASIKLSFDYLETKDLRTTILLIRFANLTSVDELLMYGTGLGLFEGINEMEARRNRVLTLVQQLKDSCLLLDSDTISKDFSMHDVVRDVAMAIASEIWHVFTNESFDKLQLPDKNTLKIYDSIVLKDVVEGELPQALECQQLNLLSLSGKFSFMRSRLGSAINFIFL